MARLRDLIRSEAVVRQLEEMAGYKSMFVHIVRPFAAHDAMKRKTVTLNPGWYEVEKVDNPYGRSRRLYKRSGFSIFSGLHPKWFVIKGTRTGERVQAWLAAGTFQELSQAEIEKISPP